MEGLEMPHDVQTLRQWLRIVMIITAFCSTALPLVYSLTGWRKFKTGRLFMLLSLSFATAIDVTVLFSFWRPKNVLVIFWVDALLFTFIAAASLSLIILVIKMNYLRWKESR
jgi:branched-subunit amino acid ABC-type transport system permease component